MNSESRTEDKYTFNELSKQIRNTRTESMHQQSKTMPKTLHQSDHNEWLNVKEMKEEEDFSTTNSILQRSETEIAKYV